MLVTSVLLPKDCVKDPCASQAKFTIMRGVTNLLKFGPLAAFAVPNFNEIIEFRHGHKQAISLMEKGESVYFRHRFYNWNVVMPAEGIERTQRKMQSEYEKRRADKNIFR